MLKYQIGYDSFPIRYVCPYCKTAIYGEAVNKPETSEVLYKMDNADLEVSKEVPDYYFQISREFPTKHIKPYEKKDELDFAPFIKWSALLFDEQNGCFNENLRYYRARQFSECPTEEIRKILDLMYLWQHGNRPLLKEKLSSMVQFPEVNIIPIDTELGKYMRLHQAFVFFTKNLLPLDWTDNIGLFQLMTKVYQSNGVATNNLISAFSENGTLTEYEIKALSIIEDFFFLSRQILPAFLLLDFPSLRNESYKYSISTASFEELKTFYQKSHEYIIEAVNVLIALNNVLYRGAYNVLPDKAKLSFADYCNGNNKMRKFDECLDESEQFSKFIISRTNNVVRNSIGHNDTDFDGITQVIKFQSRNKGKIKEKHVPLIEFATMCIENFESCFYIFEVVYQLQKCKLTNELPFNVMQGIVSALNKYQLNNRP